MQNGADVLESDNRLSCIEREQRNMYQSCHLILDSLSMLFWLNISVLFGLNLSISLPFFSYSLTATGCISFSISILNQASHFQLNQASIFILFHCPFTELHIHTYLLYNN